MPIEIRELVIRTVVGDKQEPKESTVSKIENPDKREDIIEDIVNECVDRVMEVLRYKSER